MDKKEQKHTPLVMFPNGWFARVEHVPEGCVVVEEDYKPLTIGGVIDQTDAVLELKPEE